MEIEQDCFVLLDRALRGKNVNCFGADGCGSHGQSQFPHFYTVGTIEVLCSRDGKRAVAQVELIGYDSQVQGHVFTDRNLEISINKLLGSEYINSTCWTWADLSFQTRNSFAVELDVGKLLDW